MARLIVEPLRKCGNLRGVIAEDRSRASGTLACEVLKQAPDDGTAIMFAQSATAVLPMLTFHALAIDPRTDLAPIAGVGTVLPVFAGYADRVSAKPAR